MAVSAPVETKVAAGSAAAVVTGVVTWILVTYIPSWHAGLPPALATFLPWVVSSVLGSVTAYLSKHTPRQDEVVAAAVKLLSDAGVQIPAKM